MALQTGSEGPGGTEMIHDTGTIQTKVGFQIPVALDALESRIKDLSVSLGELWVRLNPVVRSTEPEPVGTKPIRAGQQAPMAERLDIMISELERMIEATGYVLGRLEL
jgi:hypothetical protein